MFGLISFPIYFCKYVVISNLSKNVIFMSAPKIELTSREKEVLELLSLGYNSKLYYDLLAKSHGKASDCVECGQCEAQCPQHISIIDNLKSVVEAFEQ